MWQQSLKGSITARYNEYLVACEYYRYKCSLYLFARWTNISSRRCLFFFFQEGHPGNAMMITMKLCFILVNIDLFLWKCHYIGNTFFHVYLVAGRLPWRNDWSQHWKSVVPISYYWIFILALVPGRLGRQLLTYKGVCTGKNARRCSTRFKRMCTLLY